MALGRALRIWHLPYVWRWPVPHLWWLPLYGAVPLRPATRDNPGEMGGRVASPTLVGRIQELQFLEAARRRAADGEPAVVLVGGEAGVGKTRLVGEFASRCAADGTRVLVGGCMPVGDGALPYAPILEALRPLPDELGTEAVRELAGPSWPELARLLPSLGEPLAGPAGEAAQSRLFELLLGLLGRLAEQAPLVLVVEDLHWADQSTRDLLAFLVRNLRRNRVLVVVTYRNDEPGQERLGPFLAELDRGGPVQRLELPRLDQAQTTAQLVGILGVAPAAEVVDAVFARSEGNPYFTEELLAAVRAGSRALPVTLRDLLRGRVQALSQPAQQVLGVVAVGGRPVPHRLLAKVAGLDDAHLDAPLRAGVTHSYWLSGPAREAMTYAMRCYGRLSTPTCCPASGLASTPPSPGCSPSCPSWLTPRRLLPRPSSPLIGTRAGNQPRPWQPESGPGWPPNMPAPLPRRRAITSEPWSCGSGCLSPAKRRDWTWSTC
jgi:AAA ATPase domain